jgi:hypothetical protein
MPIVTGIQPNVFRAVSGSLFSSAVNWSRGLVPTGSDVAVIADNCVIDVNRTIGSLVVRPGVTASINTGLTVRVNDLINVLGHLSCIGNPNIYLQGRKNAINTLSPGSSVFYYSGSSNQSVAGVTYNTLRINGAGNKTLNGNLIVSGNLFFDTAASLDLFSYDMSVSGSTNLGGSLTTYRLIKSKPGNVLFNGGTSQETFSTAKAIDFSGGNPNVEVRNGLTITEYQSSPTNILAGYGRWVFSTNNQNLSCLISFLGDVLVSGSINLNLQFSNVSLYKPINGTTGSASLTNRGTINYYTANAGNNMMRTGSFDYLTHLNTQNYVINGPYTLPYTTYRNLGIGNPSTGGSTGTMFLSGSTIVSGSLTVVSSHYLECSSSSLEVTGSTYVQAFGTIFKSSNVGRVIFGGNFRGDFFAGAVAIDFSASNASAEFRNGIYTFYYQGNNVTFKTGTGSWYFTTNNQAINSNIGSGNASYTTTYDCPIIISGAITLDITNTNLYFNNTINGTEAASKFKNSSVIYFASSQSLNGSFRTGSYDFTSSVNTVYIGGNYSATIPSTYSSSFYNLGISGTGIKTLGTSSYVSGSLTLSSAGGSLELSSSNLTVIGTTTINQNCNLTKSGSGNIIFNGPVTISTGVANTPNVDFSVGNPTIEVRNGMNGGGFTFLMNTGTGSLNFTTNNQTIDFSFCSDSPKFRSPITINGIQLTIEGRLAGRAIYTFYNTIDGTNANSRLINNGWIRFASASITNPMSTFGTFTHTGSIYSYIDYFFDGDFAIPYSNYFGLAIAGTGSKYLTKDLTVTELLASSGSNSILNIGNYNFINVGRTSSATAGAALLIRNPGSGSVLFSGSVDQNLNFSGSTGTTEFRNGLDNNTNPSFFTGTGNWIFSTNNQGLNITYSGVKDFDCSITVSGSITLSIPAAGPGIVTHNFRGPLNGTVANSRFLMNTNSSLNYYNSATPMATGILDVTSSLGTTFIYASGSQDVKGGTYRNLTFLNGLKTLQGNVSVLGTFSTGSGATSGSINYNGFTLTNP